MLTIIFEITSVVIYLIAMLRFYRGGIWESIAGIAVGIFLIYIVLALNGGFGLIEIPALR